MLLSLAPPHDYMLPSGGWQFSFNDTDRPQWDPQIHMYGVAFVLNALSTYYHTTGNAEAGILAHATFKSIYARRAADGGVFPGAYELDYKTELAKPKDVLGRDRKGRGSVNVHIHLVEALTAYHAFVAAKGNDAELKQRSAGALEGAAELVAGMKAGPRMVELRDAVHATKPAQNRDPTDEQVMFLPGHNVEATFLINDAYDVLGKAGAWRGFHRGDS